MVSLLWLCSALGKNTTGCEKGEYISQLHSQQARWYRSTLGRRDTDGIGSTCVGQCTDLYVDAVTPMTQNNNSSETMNMWKHDIVTSEWQKWWAINPIIEVISFYVQVTGGGKKKKKKESTNVHQCTSQEMTSTVSPSLGSPLPAKGNTFIFKYGYLYKKLTVLVLTCAWLDEEICLCD